ncbi:MAG: hypothetical protein FJW61_01015 [Actinobacteria bacterium]|nr:hypothetical protein [Actinomycetota bacterium]
MSVVLEKSENNTQKTISIALQRAKGLGIKDFVVASCTGKTAMLAVDMINSEKSFNLKDINLVCVTHQIGFIEPNSDEMSKEMRKVLYDKGVKILTATHLLGGVDRALRFQFKGVYPAEIVSATLRMFGQGIKVCVEIAVMAADAGMVSAGKDIITVGGTGSGADAAAVICPSHSQDFFKTVVREVICKPW